MLKSSLKAAYLINQLQMMMKKIKVQDYRVIMFHPTVLTGVNLYETSSYSTPNISAEAQPEYS